MYLAKHLPKTNAVLKQSSIKFVGHHKVLQKEQKHYPFQYRLDLPLHWKIRQSRLKYLAMRLLYKDNGPFKNCGHQVLKRRAKTANSKKARLANLLEKQISQPTYLAKHLPETNAVLNQSSMRFVGHRKVLQRVP